MKAAIYGSILLVVMGSAIALVLTFSSHKTNQVTDTESFPDIPVPYALDYKGPIPPRLDTETLRITLTVSKGENPLSEKYAAFELTNNGDKPIEIKSSGTFGLFELLDIEIIDSSGNRISDEFYRATLSSPFSLEPRLCATISPGKSINHPLCSDLFEGISKEKLKPGKYKCRLRIRYHDQNKFVLFESSSEQIEVELTQHDLDKQPTRF
jgi:hypothetical protein